jgi:hypothetical protein
VSSRLTSTIHLVDGCTCSARGRRERNTRLALGILLSRFGGGSGRELPSRHRGVRITIGGRCGRCCTAFEGSWRDRARSTKGVSAIGSFICESGDRDAKWNIVGVVTIESATVGNVDQTIVIRWPVWY